MKSRSLLTLRVSRRHFLGGATASAVAAILAACGGSNATDTPKPAGSVGATTNAASASSPTTAAATAGATTNQVGSPAAPTVLASSGAVTLEVWGGQVPEVGPADLIDAFQKVYPKIKVNYTRWVSDDAGNTKLDTALQGGTPIDVYFAYDIPRMSQRIKAGLAEDLTPYVNADGPIKQWTDTTQGIFKYENKLYSIPTNREFGLVFLNKKLIDAAGITLPEKWTTDEFHAIAKQLSTGSGDKQVYGTFLPPLDLARKILGPDYWYTKDGSASNFDNPAFKRSNEFNKAMMDDKSAFPWSDVLAQNLSAYSQAPYLNGQVATFVAQTFYTRYVKDMQQYPHDFVTTFAPEPTPTGVTQSYNSTASLSSWIMMQQKSKAKDAAWAFIRFFLGDGAKYMIKAGKHPALPGTDLDTIVNGILGSDREKLFDAAAYKKVVYTPDATFTTDTITTGLAEIQSIYQQQSDRYLIGEISSDQWTTTMKQQADAAIKKAKA